MMFLFILVLEEVMSYSQFYIIRKYNHDPERMLRLTKFKKIHKQHHDLLLVEVDEDQVFVKEPTLGTAEKLGHGFFPLPQEIYIPEGLAKETIEEEAKNTTGDLVCSE